MQKRKLINSVLCVTVLAASVLLPVQAEQTIKLTIASSNSTTSPWVGLMSTLFVPEVNKLVKVRGKGYKIVWKESYEVLFGMRATLPSLGFGIADISFFCDKARESLTRARLDRSVVVYAFVDLWLQKTSLHA